jgi:hypothetical protein
MVSIAPGVNRKVRQNVRAGQPNLTAMLNDMLSIAKEAGLTAG